MAYVGGPEGIIVAFASRSADTPGEVGHSAAYEPTGRKNSS
jgi:hypothetical protein